MNAKNQHEIFGTITIYIWINSQISEHSSPRKINSNPIKHKNDSIMIRWMKHKKTITLPKRDWYFFYSSVRRKKWKATINWTCQAERSDDGPEIQGKTLMAFLLFLLTGLVWSIGRVTQSTASHFSFFFLLFPPTGPSLLFEVTRGYAARHLDHLPSSRRKR